MAGVTAVQRSGDDTRVKRVLLYSHDTVGMGNIRRALVVANYIVERRPDVTVLIVSGSPMLHAFRIRPGIDYLKLPCLDRSAADGYRVKSLGIQFKDLIRLRANLIQHTVVDFDPDLILVDKKPLGVGRELAPAFEMLNLRGARPRCALILRDILDHPAQTKKIWAEHRYYDAIDAFYDNVLVLGTREVFDLPREYGFPAHLRHKVDFCGYLRRPAGLRGGAAVRDQLGVGEAPLVLVTVGGGEDGAPLLDAYFGMLAAAGANYKHHSLILTGPEMAASERRRMLKAAAALPRCHIGEFSSDTMSDIAAADLVIAMGGYNTVCEILTLNKPAVIVPRAAPVQEQLIRAQRMSQLGYFNMLHPDQLTPGVLGDTVRGALATALTASRAKPVVQLDGLGHLARAVDSLLADDEPAASISFADARLA